MTEKEERSPWLCHVCDTTSTSESTACSVCYKTTCPAHLRHRSAYDKESGLYRLQPICVYCLAEENLL